MPLNPSTFRHPLARLALGLILFAALAPRAFADELGECALDGEIAATLGIQVPFDEYGQKAAKLDPYPIEKKIKSEDFDLREMSRDFGLKLARTPVADRPTLVKNEAEKAAAAYSRLAQLSALWSIKYQKTLGQIHLEFPSEEVPEIRQRRQVGIAGNVVEANRFYALAAKLRADPDSLFDLPDYAAFRDLPEPPPPPEKAVKPAKAKKDAGKPQRTPAERYAKARSRVLELQDQIARFTTETLDPLNDQIVDAVAKKDAAGARKLQQTAVAKLRELATMYEEFARSFRSAASELSSIERTPDEGAMPIPPEELKKRQDQRNVDAAVFDDNAKALRRRAADLEKQAKDDPLSY